MRGIIIAAGRGLRMRPLTVEVPKCMLEIAGRPLIDHTMAHMRAAGCDEFVIVVGHLEDRVLAGDAARVLNADYAQNNILHSLMSAREHLDGPVMCSYADIWVEPHIHEALAATPGEIVLAVDRDWRPYYEGRTEHPVVEAETAFFEADGRVRRIGKHLNPAEAPPFECGEFLGLWRMSAEGTRLFRETFDEYDRRLARDAPFQHASRWWQAYITDMIEELLDRDHEIRCAVIERGWAELDTLQDYRRLERIAQRQGLASLVSGLATQPVGS